MATERFDFTRKEVLFLYNAVVFWMKESFDSPRLDAESAAMADGIAELFCDSYIALSKQDFKQ